MIVSPTWRKEANLTCTTCSNDVFAIQYERRKDNMNELKNNRTPRLLPAECKVVSRTVGLLLIGVGNLLSVHPDLRGQLSPHSIELILEVGESLHGGTTFASPA